MKHKFAIQVICFSLKSLQCIGFSSRTRQINLISPYCLSVITGFRGDRYTKHLDSVFLGNEEPNFLDFSNLKVICKYLETIPIPYRY